MQARQRQCRNAVHRLGQRTDESQDSLCLQRGTDADVYKRQVIYLNHKDIKRINLAHDEFSKYRRGYRV